MDLAITKFVAPGESICRRPVQAAGAAGDRRPVQAAGAAGDCA
jgi:hypothetical protein